MAVICDLCGAKSTCRIIFSDDDQRFDLCETHKRVIIDLVTTPAPQRPEPKEKPRQKPGKNQE